MQEKQKYIDLEEACYYDRDNSTWYCSVDPVFYTDKAYNLFRAAEAAGILWLDPNDKWCKGNITKAQLAYWCICASTYLGMDRASKKGHPQTNWKPFEKVFGYPAGKSWIDGKLYEKSNPLAATLHNMDYTKQEKGFGAVEELKKPIDDFFNSLEASTPEE